MNLPAARNHTDCENPKPEFRNPKQSKKTQTRKRLRAGIVIHLESACRFNTPEQDVPSTFSQQAAEICPNFRNEKLAEPPCREHIGS
ncbi:MAG: hypothetical protein JXR23_07475 [Pontiellaceae bacterium]|nr:hypothetical protein [Pontiellaceae bacterium]